MEKSHLRINIYSQTMQENVNNFSPMRTKPTYHFSVRRSKREAYIASTRVFSMKCCLRTSLVPARCPSWYSWTGSANLTSRKLPQIGQGLEEICRNKKYYFLYPQQPTPFSLTNPCIFIINFRIFSNSTICHCLSKNILFLFSSKLFKQFNIFLFSNFAKFLLITNFPEKL